MFSKYTNFVRSTSASSHEGSNRKLLSGEEAAKLYLEEIKEAKNIINVKSYYREPHKKCTKKIVNNKLSDTNLFVVIQNNDVETLRDVLDKYPDKVNLIDEFGWSLLMIACQANSVEIVEELLRKGANTSIRDKAGNSAQSLVIKNKNYILADLLLNYKNNSNEKVKYNKTIEPKSEEVYMCDICNKMFPDREEHLSSTLHNIGASKGKTIKPTYAIPQSNKGFQIMLKGGWDTNRGLGPDGLGKQYPIKTVQKHDKKGLGLEKRRTEDTKFDKVKHKSRKILINNYHDNRKFEIMFRREFY